VKVAAGGGGGKDGPSRPAPPLLGAVEELAIGCLAGVVAKGLVSPLSMIVVRMQTSKAKKEAVEGGKAGDEALVDEGGVEKPNRGRKEPDSDEESEDGDYQASPSALKIAREIYDEQGIGGFWSGFQSTIILVRPPSSLPILPLFYLPGPSPIVILIHFLFFQPVSLPLTSHPLQTLNPAITYYTFAALQRALIPAKHREHPRPAQTFLCGAVASAFASFVVYPLILAKVRLCLPFPRHHIAHSRPSDRLVSNSAPLPVVASTPRNSMCFDKPFGKEDSQGCTKGLKRSWRRGSSVRGLSCLSRIGSSTLSLLPFLRFLSPFFRS
jgi:hypothetical protein